jgi:hypothetical protein
LNTVTFDLYDHLIPGTEAEAVALLDAYLGAHIRAEAATVRAVGFEKWLALVCVY